jgi:DNA-binding transcriptional MerR regulator
MDLMTIGEFAARTRLSPKALRLYDRLGLLRPAETDPATGYRRYRADQVGPARLIAQLRRVGLPLPAIADITARPPAAAAAAVGEYWARAESVTAERRALVRYIQATLTGEVMTSYDIQTRAIPARTLASVTRHLHLAETDEFFADAFARLRAAGPGIEGIAGCPFVVYYGEVSDDSDGPLELSRPLARDPRDEATADPVTAGTGAGGGTGLSVRSEPAHEEAFIRLAARDMSWPAIAPAVDALEAWLHGNGRQPAAPPRQVLIADLRTATPDTPAFDLSVPLR